MPSYPLQFEPILKNRVWGGRRLLRYSKHLPDNQAIGESWEIADLPDLIEDGQSHVLNGPLAGRTLRSLMVEDRDALLGDTKPGFGDGFPLLVKYLDARENLSVQVHPGKEYCREHPGTHEKHEAWVIIEAEPGAVIYRGFRPGTGRDDLVSCMQEDRIQDILEHHVVRQGECYSLPSGTCHALGAGILVAEIQTPSDTTFRVWDWGREGRTLHQDSALQCMDLEPPPPPPDLNAAHEVDGLSTLPLLTTGFFAIERVEASVDATLTIQGENRPVILMLLQGTGTVAGGGMSFPISAGSTILLPASLEETVLDLSAFSTVLQVFLPHPSGAVIA